MRQKSISSIVACHACPVRYELMKSLEQAEPEKYTVAKQLSYALGRPLDAAALWEDIRMISPDISDDWQPVLETWVDACTKSDWQPADEYDVRVSSVRLGVGGTLDRLLPGSPPTCALMRVTEAPEAGVWGADRIRAACFVVCIEETLGFSPSGITFEYLASGISRTCVPEPRDRRRALQAIRTADAIDGGMVPRKPRNAPCDGCFIADACTVSGPKKLSDLFSKE
ncbi:CRISPR-associated protein Cas4 [Methanogenium cariaci]|jgi:CRISPR-associated exonuclease Cas4